MGSIPSDLTLMNTRNQILKQLKRLHKEAFDANDQLLLSVIDTALAFAQGRSDDDVLMIMESHGLVLPDETE